MGTIGVILTVAAVFAVLVFVHEFGHFIVAKMSGIRVLQFAIGMGPVIIKWGKGETLYSIRALPIGGYCMMEGEDKSSDDERAFSNKPLYIRFLVVVSGAVMNILLGFIICVFIAASSQSIATTNISNLIPSSNMAIAGVENGDKIVKLNKSVINIYDDIAFFMYKNKENPVDVTVVKADGTKKTYDDILPVYDEELQKYIFGFKAAEKANTFTANIGESYYRTIFISKSVVSSIGDLVTGKLSTDDIGGPVRIVGEIGTAAKEIDKDAKKGTIQLFFIVALLSINLGVFNLLPIPALDGGRILFMLIELLMGKPVPPEREGFVHFVGFAILIGLMVFVTFNDIMAIFK